MYGDKVSYSAALPKTPTTAPALALQELDVVNFDYIQQRRRRSQQNTAICTITDAKIRQESSEPIQATIYFKIQ